MGSTIFTRIGICFVIPVGDTDMGLNRPKSLIALVIVSMGASGQASIARAVEDRTESQAGLRLFQPFGIYWDSRFDSTPKRKKEESLPILKIFHSVRECTSSPCVQGSPAMYVLLNAPSNGGDLREAALKRFHTHTSALYVQSYGQASKPSTIQPSGIHLEPHGSSGGLRVDAANSSGNAIRVEVPSDGKGILVVGSPRPSKYCESADHGNCEARAGAQALIDLRGGVLRMSDSSLSRQISRNGRSLFYLHRRQVGEVEWRTWNRKSAAGRLACTCVFNQTVESKSLVRVSPGRAGYLVAPHSYSVQSVWGPGSAPQSCRATQLAWPMESSKAYGIGSPPEELTKSAGFEVCLHQSEEDPAPERWDPSQPPASFSFEVLSDDGPLN